MENNLGSARMDVATCSREFSTAQHNALSPFCKHDNRRERRNKKRNLKRRDSKTENGVGGNREKKKKKEFEKTKKRT
jgi:hypothetical protein